MALVASLVGLFVACYLTATDIVGKVPPCGPEETCSKVLLSRYAHLGPLPVSSLGIAFYAFALVLLCKEMSGASRTRTLGFVWSLLGLLASFGLTYVAVFKLHAVCKWCLTSAISSAALFVAWGQIVGSELRSFRREVPVLYGVAGAFVAILSFLLPFTAGDEILPHSQAALDSRKVAQLIPDGRHTIGKGPPTVIFFGDLGCPSCEFWFPRYRKMAQEKGVKFAYRYLFKHSEVRKLTEMAERVHAKDYWKYLDAAFALENDSGDQGPFLESWRAKGLVLSEEEAGARVDADTDFAHSLGFSETPTIVWIGADGVRRVYSPSVGYGRMMQLKAPPAPRAVQPL